MRITYKGDYALKAVLDLALHYNRDLLTIHDMAGHINAPIKFLEQVLLALKNGGFIESRRGSIGGYLLAMSPDKITVGEIARFIDGPIEPISCVKQGYAGCADTYKCAFKKIWQDVSQATSSIIDNVTFEDLVSQVNSANEAFAYSI